MEREFISILRVLNQPDSSGWAGAITAGMAAQLTRLHERAVNSIARGDVRKTTAGVRDCVGQMFPYFPAQPADVQFERARLRIDIAEK